MVDFADDTSTELERKAVALKWVSLIETLSYVGLAAFWLTGNKPARFDDVARWNEFPSPTE